MCGGTSSQLLPLGASRIKLSVSGIEVGFRVTRAKRITFKLPVVKRIGIKLVAVRLLIAVIRLATHHFDSIAGMGLKARPTKCVFGAQEIPYVGHLLSSRGVRPMEA